MSVENYKNYVDIIMYVKGGDDNEYFTTELEVTAHFLISIKIVKLIVTKVSCIF